VDPDWLEKEENDHKSVLSRPPLLPPHPFVSPALLAFLARPSGLLGNAGLESLGAGTGVGLSLSGEGGSEERGGEVGTGVLCSFEGAAGSSAQPICGAIAVGALAFAFAFAFAVGTGGWGGGWEGGWDAARKLPPSTDLDLACP